MNATREESGISGPGGRASTYAIVSPEGAQRGPVAGPGVGKLLTDPSFTVTIDKPGRLPAGVEKTILWPSGDQLKASNTLASTTSRAAPPSAFMTQMPRVLSRADTNAIWVPSGEYAGRSSSVAPEVNGRASPPLELAVQRFRFPDRAELNTSRSPWGESVGSKSPPYPFVRVRGESLRALPPIGRATKDCWRSYRVAT